MITNNLVPGFSPTCTWERGWITKCSQGGCTNDGLLHLDQNPLKPEWGARGWRGDENDL